MIMGFGSFSPWLGRRIDVCWARLLFVIVVRLFMRRRSRWRLAVKLRLVTLLFVATPKLTRLCSCSFLDLRFSRLGLSRSSCRVSSSPSYLSWFASQASYLFLVRGAVLNRLWCGCLLLPSNLVWRLQVGFWWFGVLRSSFFVLCSYLLKVI